MFKNYKKEVHVKEPQDDVMLHLMLKDRWAFARQEEVRTLQVEGEACVRGSWGVVILFSVNYRLFLWLRIQTCEKGTCSYILPWNLQSPFERTGAWETCSYAWMIKVSLALLYREGHQQWGGFCDGAWRMWRGSAQAMATGGCVSWLEVDSTS